MSRIRIARHTSLPVCLALLLALLLPALAQAHGEKQRPEKTGILLAFFGTSVPEAEAALQSLENKVKAAYPKCEVRRAYSSNIIRAKLAESGQRLDSPAKALATMMEDGVTKVAVLTTLVIPGEEYSGLARTVAAFDGMPKGFDAIALSEPLMSSPKDMPEVAAAFMKTVPAERKPTQAVVFMGHGTHHPGNIYYPGLQYYLSKLDPNTYVGTVEGTPSLDDVAAELKKHAMKSAYLIPLMAVAGDHAQNDMAGDEPDSWKSILTAQGVTCIPVLRGMAGQDPIAAIYLKRLAETLNHLEK
ncbi:sirohydrochlorin cobaltochelatase [Desulfolutivibrio sulfoxidireducens]|uniref:sirohydrochlorin cobaltochelatase n=1 Tax=Desulfolutivibrio sulfoxidireducens TaxID=2773299 RepID=UPI00159E1B90|nr:sirohydrochlorin cobaltochelatase [Desulfolutivibrio sulfoxidireducens]QLA15318.1 sirohydrochlorin cobaltochelatase [Desulfolutivibrio sulfoxidireducens]